MNISFSLLELQKQIFPHSPSSLDSVEQLLFFLLKFIIMKYIVHIHLTATDE